MVLRQALAVIVIVSVLLAESADSWSSSSKRFRMQRKLMVLAQVGPAKAETSAAPAQKPASKLIDGKAIAAQIRHEVADAVKALAAESARSGPPIVPGLAVVLVGDRPDSATYVRMKRKACEQAGVVDFGRSFPATVDEAELIAHIAHLNADPRVHGILVQLPLPSHINEQVLAGELRV